MAPKSNAEIPFEGSSKHDQVKSTSDHLQQPAKDAEKNQTETDENGGSTQYRGVRLVLLLLCLFLGNFLVGYVCYQPEDAWPRSFNAD